MMEKDLRKLLKEAPMTYNIVATLDLDFSVDDAIRVVDELSAYHPAASERGGRLGVIITLPAASLAQAATSGLTVIERLTGAAIVDAEIMTTDEFDARDWAPPMPELVSVTEAADQLGVTRQAILKQAAGGGFRTARQVGHGWVFARSEIQSRVRPVSSPS